MSMMFGFSKKMVDDFIHTGIMPKSKFCIPKQWHYLLGAPFEISERCCYHLKKAPVKKYSAETGNKMIVGTMAEESLLRKQIWMQQGCNAFDAAEPKSTPISFWTHQYILQYLKLTQIPYCSLYGDILALPNGKLKFSGYQRTGCAGCLYGCQYEQTPNRLQKLKIQVDECCDTYLDMDGWKKGFAVVNGINIGRYWEIGPQHKLFVPKDFLKQGENEIIIFDEECGRTELKFSDEPDFTGGADGQK